MSLSASTCLRRLLSGVAILLAVLLPSAASAASAASADCGRCKEIAEKFAREEGFNGAVLVAQEGHAIYTGAFGIADAEAKTPMAPRTRFEAGSISKWITAIVTMRLVEQGRLALDEPISTYLPDYRPDTGHKLTLRWLMSHSSGVPNQVDAAVKADPSLKLKSLDNATAVRAYASGDLAFEPGTDWDYSHSNWLIVKAIVERVGGRPYPELVRTLLTEPLQLHDSGVFVGDSADAPGMAKGYQSLLPTATPRHNPVPDFMMSAGGYYTSVGDLQRLMDALFDNRILSPATVATLTEVIRPTQSYALGGRVKTLQVAGKPRKVAWEYGSNGAFRMLAWRVLEDGHSVVLANNSSFDHMRIGDLAAALLDASYDGPSPHDRPDPVPTSIKTP